MDITDVLGSFGTLQKRVFAVSIYRSLVLASISYIVHFATLNIDHWCAPEGNITTKEWKECCIPKTARGYSRCHYYSISGNYSYVTYLNSSQTECTTWEYDQSLGFTSLISEFNLVCSSRWQVSIMYTLFGIGSFVGYGPSGYLSDKYGRRPLLFFGLSVMIICSVLSSFSTSTLMFGVLRILTGFGYTFVQPITLTIFMETSGTRHRSLVPYIYSGSWGIGVMLQAALTLYIPSWRWFILFYSLPLQIILFILIIGYVPESLRWLFAAMKYEEAEKELKKQAAVNGISIVDTKGIMESLKEKIEKAEAERGSVHTPSMGAFFKSRRLVTVSFILFFLNAIRCFQGSGFSVTLRNFGGVVQVNYIMHGLTSILSVPVFELTRSFVKWRRLTLIGCYGISGIMFVVIIFISDDLHWLRLTLAMSSNVIKKVASASLYLTASEIFPTHLRGRGVGFYQMSGRLGSILGGLTDLLAYEHGLNAPLILFAVISLAICVTICFLPETQDCHLPDSVAESDKIAKLAPGLELKKKRSLFQKFRDSWQ